MAPWLTPVVQVEIVQFDIVIYVTLRLGREKSN